MDEPTLQTILTKLNALDSKLDLTLIHLRGEINKAVIALEQIISHRFNIVESLCNYKKSWISSLHETLYGLKKRMDNIEYIILESDPLQITMRNHEKESIQRFINNKKIEKDLRKIKNSSPPLDHTALLVYPKQAQEILGVGTTKFYQLAKLPDFPKPKLLNGKRPMYIRKELENWALCLLDNPSSKTPI